MALYNLILIIIITISYDDNVAQCRLSLLCSLTCCLAPAALTLGPYGAKAALQQLLFVFFRGNVNNLKYMNNNVEK